MAKEMRHCGAVTSPYSRLTTARFIFVFVIVRRSTQSPPIGSYITYNLLSLNYT